MISARTHTGRQSIRCLGLSASCYSSLDSSAPARNPWRRKRNRWYWRSYRDAHKMRGWLSCGDLSMKPPFDLSNQFYDLNLAKCSAAPRDGRAGSNLGTGVLIESFPQHCWAHLPRYLRETQWRLFKFSRTKRSAECHWSAYGCWTWRSINSAYFLVDPWASPWGSGL